MVVCTRSQDARVPTLPIDVWHHIADLSGFALCRTIRRLCTALHASVRHATPSPNALTFKVRTGRTFLVCSLTWSAQGHWIAQCDDPAGDTYRRRLPPKFWHKTEVCAYELRRATPPADGAKASVKRMVVYPNCWNRNVQLVVERARYSKSLCALNNVFAYVTE